MPSVRFGNHKEVYPSFFCEEYGLTSFGYERLPESLEEAHEKFLDRVASVQTSRQPHVVKYVVDALIEEDEGKDALVLAEEQKGFLFLLLKTVIDILD